MTTKSLSLSLLPASCVRADGRVDAVINVILAGSEGEERREITTIMDWAKDGALQVCGDTPWLQTEDNADGEWLEAHGSNVCELAAAIDGKGWGRARNPNTLRRE